jgi:hypothetical protein
MRTHLSAPTRLTFHQWGLSTDLMPLASWTGVKHIAKEGAAVLDKARERLRMFLAGERLVTPGVVNCDPSVGCDPMLPQPVHETPTERSALLQSSTPVPALRVFLVIPPRAHLLLLLEDHVAYAIIRFATDFVACLAWLDPWLDEVFG